MIGAWDLLLFARLIGTITYARTLPTAECVILVGRACKMYDQACSRLELVRVP